jgi:multidrug efflux pump subunit AcrB
VHTAIKEELDKLKQKYDNLVIKISGAASDNQESIDSLLTAFVYSAIMIFIILLLTFGNLYQPLMILFCIPFGLLSVAWTFFLHNMPLSFLALIGVVGLAGVVVNNAIVMIVFMNRLRDQGVENMESIKRACSTRFRPIVLTSITTVFGLMPTAYGIGGEDPFLVPMALAMGWGLALGSVLTILIIPCLQAMLDDINGILQSAQSNLNEALVENKGNMTWIFIKIFSIIVNIFVALGEREVSDKLAATEASLKV